MVTRNAVMRKIFDTVARSKSVSVVDRVLQIFDAIVIGKPIPAPALKLPGDTIKFTKERITMGTELDQLQKAVPPLRWGQTPRFIGEKVGNTTSSPEPQRTAPVTPAPTAAQTLRGSRSNSPLNGHQLAAQRCGLDPHTPGVESMTVDQMKQAAHEVNVKATAPLAFKAGLQYRR